MSVPECQLKVENLPPDIKTNKLQLFFQNVRRRGGGPVKEIQLYEHTHSAIITFEEKSAVQIVLQKGDDVEIQGNSCKISPVVPLPLLQCGDGQTPSSTNDKTSAASSPDVKIVNRVQIAEDGQSFVDGQSQNQGKSEINNSNGSLGFADKTVQIHINDTRMNPDLIFDSYKTECVDEYVFMDGLKMVVYVPFTRLEDAQKFCGEDCTDNHFIVGKEMADHKVFDHYNDMLSIHGYDFSSKTAQNELKEFVEKITGLSLIEIITGEESHSAILVFNPQEPPSELYSIANNFVSQAYKGNHLVTAPVRRSSTILAVTTPGYDVFDKKFVERYFNGKKQSNCNPMRNNAVLREDKISFIIEFENENDAKSVLRQKKHTFGVTQLNTQLWYDCLSKEAYSDYRKLREKVSAHETVILQLPIQEYVFLKRKNIHSVLQKQNVTVEPDDKTHSFTIKGPQDLLQTTRNSINEVLISIEEDNLDGFSQGALDFLREPRVLETINRVLDEQNELPYYVFEKNGKIMCFSHDKIAITKHVEKHLRKKKVCYGEKITALTSELGNKFIRDLQAKSDFPCRIVVDSQGCEVAIFTFEEVPCKDSGLVSLHDELATFVEENCIQTVSLKFPGLKYEFADKYLDMKRCTVTENDLITVKGVKSEIDQATKEIYSLRNEITVQEEVIKNFGIVEFFTSAKGKEVLNSIGEKNTCLLKLCHDGLGPSNVIGSCTVDKIKVKFVQTDITSLNVKVIVNPIDWKRQCLKGMNKFIIKNGGTEIQQKLNDYNGSTETGTLIETQGGKLHCSSIYHLILKKGEDANQLLSYVKECLRKADQDGHVSLAMPLLGCGRFKIGENVAAINIAKAVKQYATQAASLNEIIFCDQEPTHINNIMSRFDNVDQVVDKSVSDGCSDDDSSSKSHQNKDKDGKDGPLIPSIIPGDILQENCDVIVCGIKESMKLSSSGKLSKTLYDKCGDSLQNDCSKQEAEFSQEGIILTSSHGLSCKSIIFVSMTKFHSHWERGIKKVLSLAEKKGYTSIALPALGTGAKHVNVQKLKSTILHSICEFGREMKPQKLKDVRLVIFDKSILNIFQEKVSKSMPTVSTSAQVSVVYQNADNGKNAVKELKTFLEDNFYKIQTRVQETNKFSDEEIQNLITVGLNNQVKVTVQKERSTIHMESFDNHRINGVNEYVHKCVNRLKDKERDERAFRLMKTSIKWKYLSNARWIDFEPESNFKIEEAFNDKEDNVIIRDPNNRKYRIDFQTMKEFRVREGGDKEITTVNRFDLSADTPSSWDVMDCNQNLKIVQLSKSSKEYKDVEEYFKRCGASPAVTKIERIQNVVLYKQYASRKKYIENSNPPGTENERKLFHGTDSATIVDINESGFNRSFCGKNAVMYGNGVYFAEKSSYSVSYAKADTQGVKTMYLARVIVGVSTPSQRGMTHLPKKPGTNMLYDSGRGPEMFIIFHDCQAYPEYLIYF